MKLLHAHCMERHPTHLAHTKEQHNVSGNQLGMIKKTEFIRQSSMAIALLHTGTGTQSDMSRHPFFVDRRLHSVNVNVAEIQNELLSVSAMLWPHHGPMFSLVWPTSLVCPPGCLPLTKVCKQTTTGMWRQCIVRSPLRQEGVGDGAVCSGMAELRLPGRLGSILEKISVCK